MFKSIFLPGVRKMIKRGELRMPTSLAHAGGLTDMLDKVEAIDWVADVQGPGDDHRDGAQLIGYLAAYVTGAAIGNGRLIRDSGGMITFNVRDYRSATRMTETLYDTEFVLRMSYHVLPRGMPRTRYADLFRGQGRQARLDHCRELLGEPKRNQDDGPNHATSVLMPGEIEEEPERVSFVACDECDRPTDVSEELPPSNDDGDVGGRREGRHSHHGAMSKKRFASRSRWSSPSVDNGAVVTKSFLACRRV